MLQPYWQSLPPALRAKLLPGTLGSFQCLHLASSVLEAATTQAGAQPGTASVQTLLHTGYGLLCGAWEDDPLNGDLARQLLQLDSRIASHWQSAPLGVRLSPEWRAALQQLGNAFSRPAALRYYQKLAQQADYDRIMAYLDGERAKAPDNLYWLQQILAVGELAGQLDWALDHVRTHWPRTAPASLRTAVEAHTLCAMGRHADVLALPNGPELECSTLFTLRRAHSLWATGARQKALSLWTDILHTRPWQVNLLLRLHDAVTTTDTPPTEAECAATMGRTVALLYSWNKADDLDRALEALAPSAPGLAHIVALNNGSTDDTGAVMNAWQERLGKRMRVVHLPVNVGAPAARNWLKQLPEVRDANFVAYLDDDAVLPGDWLRHMARAILTCPDASVWGGKILDHHAPHVVQSADLHIAVAPAPNAGEDTPFSPHLAHGEPFNVTDIHAQVADTGGFNYIRPCLSVTGCCHLFRAEALMECGDFSLTLSPSQYDDLEHDLRLATKGGHCAYTGFLAVRHGKRTGKSVQMSAAQFGNGLGNKYKLHAMYSREQVEAMHWRECQLMEQDLLNKARTLDQQLGEISPSI